ncbi:MAG: FAD-dependent thymidylate synthase [Candidatus Blackburnbacteria bacterium]|nr:FAD-dependent thymidylate synthase [Candidatus Blackburnbacteria bacterium]
MATAEQREQRIAQVQPQEVREGLVAADTSVCVYPLGFTPELKRKLVDSAAAWGLRVGRFSDVGKVLHESLIAFQEDRISFTGLFAAAALLDDAIKDGEQAYPKEIDFITHALRTEEELAVMLARVSREPGSIEEHGRAITEEGAREFHRKWTVSVEGYGHASVAEHAIIHLAVEGIPSLDGDWVTDNRLASFTEFSARFKGRQDVGYYTPDVVKQDPVLSARWHQVHAMLFELNDLLMVKGMGYIQTDEARAKWPTRKVMTKTVADQMKNLLPASRLTSVGITLNARTAEHLIQKFLSSPYPSIRSLGSLIKEQSLRVAPTLVRYADRNEYLVAARRGIGQLAEETRFQGYIPEFREDRKPAVVLEADPRADDKLIATALFQDARTGSFGKLMELVGKMDLGEKRRVMEKLLGGLGTHDAPIRALEMPGDYIVDYPGMTYGDLREYKRHRIQSYYIKDLDVRWGYMIPPLAQEMDESSDPQFHGAVGAIKRVMGEVEGLFNAVYQVDPYTAHYCVTRLHYRPTVAKYNLRQGYHLWDLRTGPTAHPFIRRLMWPVLDQVKEVQPIIYEYLRLKMKQRIRPGPTYPWTF